MPGESLWGLATRADEERTVFSEYHALGTAHATYLLRDRRYKYVHYVGAPAQLFDLDEDPQELRNLAGLPEYGALLAEREGRLRALLDPEAVDARARAEQRAKVAAYGGEAAVRARGAFTNSPAPGEEAVFRH